MDAKEVQRLLGAPSHVETLPSSVAKSARYERWSYADHEVVLIDGKVVDTLP